jgi:hypothetical protein
VVASGKDPINTIKAATIKIPARARFLLKATELWQAILSPLKAKTVELWTALV